MKYVQATNLPEDADPDVPLDYWNADPATGTVGARPPAQVFNALQTEVLAAIEADDQVPDADDLGQLAKAMARLETVTAAYAALMLENLTLNLRVLALEGRSNLGMNPNTLL